MSNRNTPALALRMQTALTQKAHSVEALATLTELSPRSVRAWIKAMKVERTVYIEGFGEDSRGRLFVPLWRWGRKKDAVRPGSQRTSTDRMRDHRARKAANAH